MKVVITEGKRLYEERYRLDGAYHTSDGVQMLNFLHQWAKQPKPPVQLTLDMIRDERVKYVTRSLDTLGEVCGPDGIFVGDWLKRIYVNSPEHGAPYISGSSIMQADPMVGAKYLSYRHRDYIDQLALHKGMILMTCSGTIGNLVYVNANFKGTVGSPDLFRIVADPDRILPGYLYAFLSSKLGQALINKGIYGGVVQHIEIPYMESLPIPRLDVLTEERIHELIEQAASLRVEANKLLEESKQRFQKNVLGVSVNKWKWHQEHEHAYAVGTTRLSQRHYRLDAFHYVGYVGEADRIIHTESHLGDLAKPYQPPIFKRPYAGESGIPFLSGVDLYNSYPEPRSYISRNMINLERYIVKAGTILVQRSGQRYGLFGRPLILPSHLDCVAVSEHLIRVYPKDSRDRGFLYIWLSNEFGRRLLLKHSFGTSMGELSEQSFEETSIPTCSPELRHSFEPEVQQICNHRDTANILEDQAQALLAEALGLKVDSLAPARRGLVEAEV